MSQGLAYSQSVRPSRAVLRPAWVEVSADPTPLHIVVSPAVQGIPEDVRRSVIRDFYARNDQADAWPDKYAAQGWLRDQVQSLRSSRLDVAFHEERINEVARQGAALCQKFHNFEVAASYARTLGVDPPTPGKPKGVSVLGALRRLQCVRWWRRALRRQWTRTAETKLRGLGFVHRRRQLYASDRAVAWRQESKLRNRAVLQDLQAVSDHGDQLDLWGVVEKSNANPAIRRAELMTRLKGFEEVAKAEGHAADFYTLTAPSAFHRTNSDGSENPHWEGHGPRDAQAWLCRMWARARARLKRLAVLYYGFRIAEPHHDGTPHWHMVLFVDECHRQALQTTIRELWLSEYHGEPGARLHRVKFQSIDPHKGSAVAYVAKYVAKNVDGFQVGGDLEADKPTPASETAERVAAWASAHGIRQFQQVGGPAVSVWRELRRLRSGVDGASVIEACRRAADSGEWDGFIRGNGGIAAGRNGAITLWAKVTGELTQYEELRGPQVMGVQAVERTQHPEPVETKARARCRLYRKIKFVEWVGILERVRTRSKVWRIERKKKGPSARCDRTAGVASCPVSSVPLSSAPLPLGPVSITVRAASAVPSHGGIGSNRFDPSGGVGWMH